MSSRTALVMYMSYAALCSCIVLSETIYHPAIGSCVQLGSRDWETWRIRMWMNMLRKKTQIQLAIEVILRIIKRRMLMKEKCKFIFHEQVVRPVFFNQLTHNQLPLSTFGMGVEVKVLTKLLC